MVINVASFGGRTHMLDTARELAKHGHTVRFYSYVPTKRAVQFGLPKECSYSLYYWAMPFLMMFKIFGFKLWLRKAYQYVFDFFTAYYMKPCDVFIGQSPMHVRCLKRAKKKWNAITILERGSNICYEFDANQKDIPGFKPCAQSLIDREMKGYSLADYISVGADHVKEGFLKHGFAPERIFVNNYGFDGAQFAPTELQGDYDIIMVGNWSYRKGCDLIIEACKKKGYRLLHVGAKTVIGFPDDMENMTDIGQQQQYDLHKYYAKARVFVLPSREEGLALVQLQAVACGLPLVCSKSSGGRDLKQYTDKPEYIVEMNELNADELCRCIDVALEHSKEQTGTRDYFRKGLHDISFEGYGERYNAFLERITPQQDKTGDK